MSTFRELFLEQLLEDARQDQPDVERVLAIQEIPPRDGASAKVRVIIENAEEDMFFFDYDGTFVDMLLEMLNPGLAESST